jgi:hypothetical protein
MPISSLTADHLDGPDGGEPQRQNNALLRISGLTGETGQNNQRNQQGSNVGVLELSLQSFPLPKSNTNIVEVDYLNEKRKFAGKTMYDDLSVIFKDYVNKETARILNAWRYQVHNPETGVINLASVYKKRGDAILFGPNGEFERSYELIGVWPSAFDPGDIDMSTDEPVQITLTLTIDKAIPRTGLNPGDGTNARANITGFGLSRTSGTALT